MLRDRFMPFRSNLRSRPWVRRIPRRPLRLPEPRPRRAVVVVVARALVAVPPQARPSLNQMVLWRPSSSLLRVCWLPLVLPLACSKHLRYLQERNTIALGQRHYALSLAFCFIFFLIVAFRGLHLGMLFRQTVTPQLPQCSVLFFCGI